MYDAEKQIRNHKTISKVVWHMYCRKCGAQLRDEDDFCSKCGTRVIRDEDIKEPMPAPASVPEPEEKTKKQKSKVSIELTVKSPDEETRRRLLHNPLVKFCLYLLGTAVITTCVYAVLLAGNPRVTLWEFITDNSGLSGVIAYCIGQSLVPFVFLLPFVYSMKKWHSIERMHKLELFFCLVILSILGNAAIGELAFRAVSVKVTIGAFFFGVVGAIMCLVAPKKKPQQE